MDTNNIKEIKVEEKKKKKENSDLSLKILVIYLMKITLSLTNLIQKRKG